MARFFIDLDWCPAVAADVKDDAEFLEYAKSDATEVAKEHGLEAPLMVTSHGPGGGLPIMRFIGELEQIRSLVEEYCGVGMDEQHEDPEFFMKDVVPC